MKTNLNYLVKENLIKIKKNKEKDLIKERNDIKKRFDLIIENKTIKTKSQKVSIIFIYIIINYIANIYI